MSKLKKFELLSRGIKESSSSSGEESRDETIASSTAAVVAATSVVDHEESNLRADRETSTAIESTDIGKIVSANNQSHQNYHSIGHSKSTQLSTCHQDMLRSALNANKSPANGADLQAKSEYLLIRDGRSKSFGCEKDLRLINNTGGVPNNGRRNGAGTSGQQKNSSSARK